MPEHRFHPSDPRHPGMFANLAELLANILSYIKARATLLGLEGKEAGIHYGLIVGMIVGALIILIFGYVFLIVTLVFAVALAFGGGNAWIGVMGAAAVLHLVGAVVLVLIAKNRLKSGMFAMTVDEFQKDSQWLHQLTKKN